MCPFRLTAKSSPPLPSPGALSLCCSDRCLFFVGLFRLVVDLKVAVLSLLRPIRRTNLPTAQI